MKCKCGEQAELKVFNTFQYYFCNKCKIEIEKEEPKEYDPFDPNTGSISDFYLDLSRKNIDQALKNIAQGFKDDDLVMITLPKPQKSMHFEIYRRCADDSFEKLHVEQVHYEVSSDGKTWNRTETEKE